MLAKKSIANSKTAEDGAAPSDFSDAALVQDYLHRAMARAGWDVAELARQVGVSYTTIGNPAAGKGAGRMAFALLRRIAERTGEPLPLPAAAAPGLAEDAAPAPAMPEDLRERRLVAELAPGARNASVWTVKTAALQLAGIVPGDKVVLDPDAAPREGDAVIAQLYDWDRVSARTVLRLFQPPYLVAAAADAVQYRPITLDQAVGIKGAIVARYQLRR